MWTLLTSRRRAAVLSRSQLLRIYNCMVTLRAKCGTSKASARDRVNWEVLNGQWF